MLTIEEFGHDLLGTGDLDPVYIAVHKAALPRPVLNRLILAYIFFYSLGTAARLAERKDYWAGMMEAAVNEGDPKPWPRGGERRHYRGAQAVNSMKELIGRYPTADAAVKGLLGPPPYTFESVNRAALGHRGIGEWAAFKVVDLAEQVLGYDVDTRNVVLGVYKDPRQGAALAKFGDKDHPITNDELNEVIRRVVEMFRGYKAEPRGHRAFGPLEAETVLCKWKSHMRGHYPLGKDTREIRHGLEAFPSKLGDKLLKGMPEVRA